MNIHEHQAKQILKKYGASVPKGDFAFTVNELIEKAKKIKTEKYVLKAQIHAGGRGKAGGVKILNNIEELTDAAKEMLGKTLITHQTGPNGKEVKRLYIEESSKIKKEFYLSCLIDRASSKIAFISSDQGGMDIEEVAKKSPEKIITTKVDYLEDIDDENCKKIIKIFNLKDNTMLQGINLIKSIYKMFTKTDANMVEINPLVLTGDDHVLALDCKMSFDDNALYRNPELAELRDKSQEDPKETYAADRGLNYIPLDGDIGNIINGAGLAMASMDMIQLAGGQPANFLDVGGGATPEKFVKAFKLISGDPKVKVILINIFAGINRCDWVAQGIVDALNQITINQPLVIRLAGTNVDEGIKILKDSKITYTEAFTLEDAANKAVKALKELGA